MTELAPSAIKSSKETLMLRRIWGPDFGIYIGVPIGGELNARRVGAWSNPCGVETL